VRVTISECYLDNQPVTNPLMSSFGLTPQLHSCWINFASRSAAGFRAASGIGKRQVYRSNRGQFRAACRLL